MPDDGNSNPCVLKYGFRARKTFVVDGRAGIQRITSAEVRVLLDAELVIGQEINALEVRAVLPGRPERRLRL